MDTKLHSTIDKVSGRAKHTAGAATGDKSLESEGSLQETKGKVTGKLADVKDKIKGDD
jgi:uncharacterized protein YjbJ (UPF0337 family)